VMDPKNTDAGLLTGSRFDLGTRLVDSPAGDRAVRPFVLRVTVTVPNSSVAVASRYCPIRQINVAPDGSPLPLIECKTLTNPDGDPQNPPPWDKD
jgi:putative ATP-grasp target RiPP